MSKTKTLKERRQFYFKVLLDGINSDDTALNTDSEKVIYAWNRFKSEYGHEIKGYGLLKACESWLQGLALDIPYYNVDILKLYTEATGKELKTEKEQDKILSNYWCFMGNNFLQLAKKHKINIFDVI